MNFEALKLAAGITLLSAFLPLLFMGEEYGEPAPFQYFTSHGDPALVEAVRRGRREEFAAFGWQESVPDPQDEKTYRRSHLNLALKQKEPHRTLYRLYQELIQIRKELGLGHSLPHSVRELSDRALLLSYGADRQATCAFNFSESPATVKTPGLDGEWSVRLNSAAGSWDGPDQNTQQAIIPNADSGLRISPYSFLLLQRVE